MKYIVMECHEGYAILMDEESRLLHAANLHYQVGQTVSDPVLLNDNSGSQRYNIRIFVTRAAAAAACIALIAGSGYSFYSQNIKVDSTILISSAANITIGLNKKGNVVFITGSDKKSEELVKNYSAKGKDKITVTNELIELEKSKGIISDGDTVDLYISADSSKDRDAYKSQIEKAITDPDVNVNVRDIEDLDNPPADRPAAASAPAPADIAPADNPPVKPADPDNAPAQAAPEVPNAGQDKSADAPAPPAPPAHQSQDAVPPAPAENVKPDTPAPPQHHDAAPETPAKPDDNISGQVPAPDKPEPKTPDNVKPAAPEDAPSERPAPVQTPDPDNKPAPDADLSPKPGPVMAPKPHPVPDKITGAPVAPEIPAADPVIADAPDLPADEPAPLDAPDLPGTANTPDIIG